MADLTELHQYQEAVDRALAKLHQEDVIARIWRHDHTVWKPDPTEITNRLGWLDSPKVMKEALGEINAFVKEVREAGFTHALLLGMGGSSLAPEVFRFTFGVGEGYLDLAVLDSTDPGAVLTHDQRLDLAKTLFIVSTKSGGTVETFSFFKYFYNRVMAAVGKEKTGEHFVAITDPGSGLVDVARKYAFRKIFENDPNIGGRYSALSYFGLVPAALLGVDVSTLLDRAQAMAEKCQGSAAAENPGAWLGATLGELALAGRDKVTLVASPGISHFGAWVEQLVAESTGKEGAGILPVDLEEVGVPENYENDRLFVYLKLDGDTAYDDKIARLKRAGHPVVQLTLQDIYDLGAEFFRWEMATVVASSRLGINPFDQPNVESAKVLARNMVAAYQTEGKLPELRPTFESQGIEVYSDLDASDLNSVVTQFLDRVNVVEGVDGPRSYVALQAYVTPNSETDDALNAFRLKIRNQVKVATTVGYGPRFLHSTGQLHKGDAGNGLFIQITSEVDQDVDIPDEAGEQASAMTFGVLKIAQALGDRQALLDAGRQVIRFHLTANVVEGIGQLAGSL